MSLSVDSITALAALGRAPLLIATRLAEEGARYLTPTDGALAFVVDLEAWEAAYGLDRIEREFPGLFEQIQHSRVFSDAVVWHLYESKLTVSLPDFSVRVVVGGNDMGACYCDEVATACRACLRCGELPALEEAMEEYYRPIIAQAVVALESEPDAPTPAAVRAR